MAESGNPLARRLAAFATANRSTEWGPPQIDPVQCMRSSFLSSSSYMTPTLKGETPTQGGVHIDQNNGAPRTLKKQGTARTDDSDTDDTDLFTVIAHGLSIRGLGR